MGQSLLNVLEEQGNAFSAYIPQSVKFVEAEADGLYIGDYAYNSKAHFQTRQVVKELLAHFNMEPRQNKRLAIKKQSKEHIA